LIKAPKQLILNVRFGAAGDRQNRLFRDAVGAGKLLITLMRRDV